MLSNSFIFSEHLFARLLLDKIMVFKSDYPFLHIFMVNNLPLLPYQARLSPIQTDWPAYSSAIYGHDCEVVSLPPISKAINLFKLAL